MATIKVTKEKGKQCLWGYPCEMWDEFALPEEGGICNNFDEKDDYDNKESKKKTIMKLPLLLCRGCYQILPCVLQMVIHIPKLR